MTIVGIIACVLVLGTIWSSTIVSSVAVIGGIITGVPVACVFTTAPSTSAFGGLFISFIPLRGIVVDLSRQDVLVRELRCEVIAHTW